MTDAVTPVLPPTSGANLASSIKAALFIFAGTIATNGANYLVSHGIITSDASAQVVSIGTGLIISAATLAYSYIQNRVKAQKLVAAAATGNPQADPKDPDVKSQVAAAIEDPNSPIQKVAS